MDNIMQYLEKIPALVEVRGIMHHIQHPCTKKVVVRTIGIHHRQENQETHSFLSQDAIKVVKHIQNYQVAKLHENLGIFRLILTISGNWLDINI